MSIDSISMKDVREFIATLPDAAAIAEVQEASAERLQELTQAAYAALVAGSTARITDDLNRACLRGLTGTVQERNRTKTRAGFLLDEESTQRLRTDPRNTRFKVPEGVKRFRLRGGIPIACLELIEDED
ncbi:hypothetical protein GCM10010358_68230 [Streptomyces minutiscleroticus]|uniref:Uncharacterized protein n=1 Tax=Streptomyces minutiscleroticus TaxID=68238 RepID=A0A918NYD4_9ACTN|nr:hypothetical protein [Streptomyces minutiscleroticus]GGY05189.1 hypothetical protein GCM10010358_68230 [Streptomyces minutiscleroticus]